MVNQCTLNLVCKFWLPSLEWVGQSSNTDKANQPKNKLEAAAMEYDSLVNLQKAELEQYSSGLNIPFTHQNYARFDANMNVLGSNTHTSVKPYDYKTVAKYYNFEENLKSLQKEKTSWLGKKFWNEHLLSIKGKDYWFTGDIVADLQLGKDLQSDVSNTS